VLRLRWMGSRWLRVYIIKRYQLRVLHKKANPPVLLRNIAPASSMVFIIFESDSPTSLHTQSLHDHPPTHTCHTQSLYDPRHHTCTCHSTFRLWQPMALNSRHLRAKRA